MATRLDDIATGNEIKETAKIIKDVLKGRFGVEIKYGWALEVSAATYGYKNWDTASGIIKNKEADEAKKEVLSTKRGLISESEFDAIVKSITRVHQTSRYDSFTRGQAIKKAAQAIGVGEFMLFDIFYVTVGHDDLSVAVREDGILGDFRRQAYKIKRERRVDLLKSLDAPEEVLTAESVKEYDSSSFSFFGYAEKGIEIRCVDLNFFVNDLIVKAMERFFVIEKEREQAWKRFDANEKAILQIADVTAEIMREIENDLFVISHQDTTDYALRVFLIIDLNAVENTKIDDFSKWIKSAKDGRKVLVPKFAKQIRNIVAQSFGIKIKSPEERLLDAIRQNETSTETKGV